MKLNFTTPEFAGQSFAAPQGKTTVGRGPRNSLVIQHNSVSTDHCEILVNGSEVIFREHGSSNGTYIDGVKVNGQAPAHNGQTVRFGQVEARIEIPPPVDSPTEITAVYSHRRAMEQPTTIAKPPSPKAPVVIASQTGEAPSDQTIIAPIARRTAAAAPAAQPAPPETRRGTAMTIFVTILVLVAVAVGWWLMKRR